MPLIKEAQSYSFNNTVIGWIIIVLFVCWGGWLRVVDLDVPSFWMDEAFSVEIAQSIICSNTWLSLTNNESDIARGPVYHNLLALVINTFGESEKIVRLPSVIAGFILIGIVIWFCLREFGGRAAIISAVLMSQGYWQIAWSRQAREYMLLTMIVWLGLSFVQKLWYIQRPKWIKAFVFAGMTAIATGVHLFGIILIAGIFFRWIVDMIDISSPRSKQVMGALSGILITIATIVILRNVMRVERLFFDIYGSFLLKTYWPLLIFVGVAYFAIKTERQRKVLIWIGLIALYGFLVICSAVPLVNLRYTFFLTPAIIIYASVGASILVKRNNGFWFLGCILWVTLATVSDVLVLTPKAEYTLESNRGKKGFHHYTPQPDFRAAYHFIDTYLGKIDLITPYPVLSRRYRNLDDVMAIDVKISDPFHPKKRYHERYTKILYANPSTLVQLVQRLGGVYILVDTMSLQRMSPMMKNLLFGMGKLEHRWDKPPYSDLFLFRLMISDIKGG